MELHMVFQQPTGEYLVVGRFIEAGSFNPLMDTIFSNLPTVPGGTFHVSSFDLTGLLPPNLQSFRYAGSLTTPPFTEGVGAAASDTTGVRTETGQPPRRRRPR
jgi:carbonic anhydrase